MTKNKGSGASPALQGPKPGQCKSHKQGTVDARKRIVQHRAKSPVQFAIGKRCRPGFDDIEESEHQKSDTKLRPQWRSETDQWPLRRSRQQGDPLTDPFVHHYRAGVFAL
jgi:hypothetical protein